MFTAVLFTVPRYGSPLNVLNRGIIKEDVATAAFKHHKIDHTHTHTHTHTHARAHTHTYLTLMTMLLMAMWYPQ